MEPEFRQDLSYSNNLFVPRDLDDANLTCEAWRLYGHLQRRVGGREKKQQNGGRKINPGRESMMRTTRLSKVKLTDAMDELEFRNMVRIERVNGRVNCYSLTTPEEWRQYVEEDEWQHTTSLRRKRAKQGLNVTRWFEHQGTNTTGDQGRNVPSNQGKNTATKVTQEGIPIEGLGQGSVDPRPGEACARAQTDPPGSSAITSGAPAGTSAKSKSDEDTPPQPPRPRNPAFDALAELDGWRLGTELTKTEAGRVVAALDSIRKAWPKLPEDATRQMRHNDREFMANEIRRRARRYTEEIFPHAPITSTALANHWSRCAPPRPTSLPWGAPPTGGKYPLPIGCDYHAVGRSLGFRILPETQWHELGHSTRAQIIEAFTSETV